MKSLGKLFRNVVPFTLQRNFGFCVLSRSAVFMTFSPQPYRADQFLVLYFPLRKSIGWPVDSNTALQ
jgi:hypothetical protein